ncbi:MULTISPECIES: GNAT family N-acetyltransferase [unclassified Rhizobium]|uniref:GNAT family N-acetyltransferase n=1 Tax=unclassified Rhizobium TaxID=2613769 RepID=UPI001AE4F29C|nr:MULTISPECIES: GNAT family N-acetyltransferase [unclassified Rhizobium]MBP2460505.1 RimJ/RimL family protein N-acetyltransferase [Rhizobium sp. PvP014]MBP2527902.1 RimJ/RimL family protein N-acetyltransferase [Rhizobium sp. PvP099]
MSKLPTFTTARLLLKPRNLADLPACLAMDRDPEVTKFIPGPWSDLERHNAFVRERIVTDFGNGLGYWSVFQHDHPELFLGWILLTPTDKTKSEIEIGWRFNRSAWGKGYATEAAKAILGYAMETLDLDGVVANIDHENLGSIQVALKIGMTDEGLQEGDGDPSRVFRAWRNTCKQL